MHDAFSKDAKLLYYIQNMPNRIANHDHVVVADRLRGLKPREAALEAFGSYVWRPVEVVVPFPDPLVGVPVLEPPAAPTWVLGPAEPGELAPAEPAPEGFPPIELAADEAAPAESLVGEALPPAADCPVESTVVLAGMAPELPGGPAELAAPTPNEVPKLAPDPAALDEAPGLADEGAAEDGARVVEPPAGAVGPVVCACAVPPPLEREPPEGEPPEGEPPAPPRTFRTAQKSRNCLNTGSIVVKPDVEALCFVPMQV